MTFSSRDKSSDDRCVLNLKKDLAPCFPAFSPPLVDVVRVVKS